MYHLQVLYINGNNIDFVCCDNPSANKLTIQILSVIAENEAEMISVNQRNISN
jgi:DNA invertase Pin-like site-specific DNA recombinase